MEIEYLLNARRSIKRMIYLFPIVLIGVAVVAFARNKDVVGTLLFVTVVYAVFMTCFKKIDKISVRRGVIAIEYFQYLRKRTFVGYFTNTSIKRVRSGSLRSKTREYLHIYEEGVKVFEVDSMSFSDASDFNQLSKVLETEGFIDGSKKCDQA